MRDVSWTANANFSYHLSLLPHGGLFKWGQDLDDDNFPSPFTPNTLLTFSQAFRFPFYAFRSVGSLGCEGCQVQSKLDFTDLDFT